MDNNGKLVPRFKIRGKSNVINEIVKKMEENADGGLDYSGKCFISHSACYEDAKAVKAAAEAKAAAQKKAEAEKKKAAEKQAEQEPFKAVEADDEKSDSDKPSDNLPFFNSASDAKPQRHNDLKFGKNNGNK